MKRRHILFGMAASVVLVTVLAGIGAFLFRKPTKADFCSGKRPVGLSRIEFKGQGVRATLSDPVTLDYLASQPRAAVVPVSITNGVSFTATLYDKYGYLGSVTAKLCNNGRIVGFGYFESISAADETYCYLLMQPNVPEKLSRLIQFLLNDQNRGKSATFR